MESSQRCRVARAIRAGFRAEPSAFENTSWGCTGFDVMIGKSGLRVRELFSVINGQTKLNDNNVVSLDAFRAAKAAKLAA